MKNKIIIKVSSVVVAMATLFLLNGNVSDKISATSVSAATEVNFMSLFKDNMVIQRDKPVKIWGTYDGNSAGVIITIKLGSEEKEAISSDNEWSVTFSPRSVSNTPQTITLKSGEITKTISGVLFGDVWLASGQSNMATPVINYSSVRDDFMAIANNSNIRFFVAPKSSSKVPLKEFQNHESTSWITPSTETILNLSAYGYAFAYYLQKGTDIPLGIIDSSYSGTMIQHWLSSEALAAAGTSFGESMYNQMINPLAGVNIKGIIWYQGESNAQTKFMVSNYKKLFEQYAILYRNVFNDSKLPIVTTQLPRFYAVNFPGWTNLRVLQWELANTIPDTYMVCGIDFGNPMSDIHPYDKLPYGKRAAELALNLIYKKSTPGESPYPIKAEVAGNKIKITFANAESGLEIRDGELKEMLILNEYGEEFQATGTVSGNTILISSKNTDSPKWVSYAMSYVPNVNLYAKNGLPVVPFFLNELEYEESTQSSSSESTSDSSSSDSSSDSSSESSSQSRSDESSDDLSLTPVESTSVDSSKSDSEESSSIATDSSEQDNTDSNNTNSEESSETADDSSETKTPDTDDEGSSAGIFIALGVLILVASGAFIFYRINLKTKK